MLYQIEFTILSKTNRFLDIHFHRSSVVMRILTLDYNEFLYFGVVGKHLKDFLKLIYYVCI